MAGTRRRYGSGIYRRGQVYWIKVRTPAAIANLLPALWRSSLRTTSDREALAAARIVRAALDMGFRAVEAGMHSGTITAMQAEAAITAVARRALASAEALRAFAGPRPVAAILAAQRAHVAEAEAWRGVLRRNELGAVLPLLAAAAAETGLDTLGDRGSRSPARGRPHAGGRRGGERPARRRPLCRRPGPDALPTGPAGVGQARCTVGCFAAGRPE